MRLVLAKYKIGVEDGKAEVTPDVKKPAEPRAAHESNMTAAKGQTDVWPASFFHGRSFHDLRLHGAGHALAGVAFRKRPAANLQGRDQLSSPGVAGDSEENWQT